MGNTSDEVRGEARCNRGRGEERGEKGKGRDIK
jgi:hypothetical protein